MENFKALLKPSPKWRPAVEREREAKEAAAAAERMLENKDKPLDKAVVEALLNGKEPNHVST